jgi:hypothetical protein
LHLAEARNTSPIVVFKQKHHAAILVLNSTIFVSVSFQEFAVSMKIAKALSQPQRTRPAVLALLLVLLAGNTLVRAYAQALPTAESKRPLDGFVTFGGMKTRVNGYFFNSLGVSAGVSTPISSMLSAEIRGGSYAIGARYAQRPFTAGIGIASHSQTHPRLFGYVGAGSSKAQDAGPHWAATRPQWSFCWQASQGLDIPVGRLRWRMYEVTWTQTYTQLRSLGSISIDSGIAYSFGRR